MWHIGKIYFLIFCFQFVPFFLIYRSLVHAESPIKGLAGPSVARNKQSKEKLMSVAVKSVQHVDHMHQRL